MPADCSLFAGPGSQAPINIQIDTECVAKTAPSRRRHANRARVAPPNEPTTLQTTSPDFRADKTGNVIAAFAPIEAGAAENPPMAGLRIELGTELSKKSDAGLRHLTSVFGQHNIPRGGHRIGDRDAKFAGHMIITGARES